MTYALIVVCICLAFLAYWSYHKSEQVQLQRAVIKALSVHKFDEEVEKTQGRQRSDKWPTVRAAFLKDHPTCEACGSSEDLEVHHVQMFHEHPELELEPTNLITLCEHPSRKCHWQYGHMAKSWSICNPQVRTDVPGRLYRVNQLHIKYA